jgi:hypothetical protein
MNQEVYDAARTLSQIDDDASVWLGITNFRDNSVFEYESDSQAVISGLWESSQPNDRNNHHCVAVQETSGTVLGKHECCYQNFFFNSNTTSIFTSVFTPTLMMLSFYSTLQKTVEYLFTFHSQFITHNTCHNSICRKRFEKGFLAEIYCVNAFVPLFMYLFLVSSHEKNLLFKGPDGGDPAHRITYSFKVFSLAPSGHF